jgi:hypothetical protein
MIASSSATTTLGRDAEGLSIGFTLL